MRSAQSALMKQAINLKEAVRDYLRVRETLAEAVTGLDIAHERSWYATTLLLRLVFLSFLERRGMLAGDPSYLRRRCERQPNAFGEFLLPLFHEALTRAPRARSAETSALCGDVPHLGGSLFGRHALERRAMPGLPDEPLREALRFLDQYAWSLDGKEDDPRPIVTPEVLGAMLEISLDRKATGTYYTGTDITRFILEKSVLPALLERVASQGVDLPWKLLAQQPGRFIPASLAHGCHLPLPEVVEAGVAGPAYRDHWGLPARPEFGLPTETWRECVARRARWRELHARLESGAIAGIPALITENVDLSAVLLAWLEEHREPAFQLAFWRALYGDGPGDAAAPLSVLDPACGAGAFLLAAADLLEPLYLASLRGLDEADRPADDDLDTTPVPPRYEAIRMILTSNLYGVDIQEEAVEICRLRLYLRLLAALGPRERLGPLPDIELHIRQGNSLVGFASLEEARQSLRQETSGQLVLLLEDTPSAVDEKARALEEHYRRARQRLAEESSGLELLELPDVAVKLHALRLELDAAYARAYGLLPDQAIASRSRFSAWRERLRPLHFPAEFFGVLTRGGFDVVATNPPYVEYSKVRESYPLEGYRTLSCGNLYAYFVERAAGLLHPRGYLGTIIPHSSICTDRMAPVQEIIRETGTSWIATFGVRPCRLFEGVDQRLAIVLLRRREGTENGVYATRYHRWREKFRPHLMEGVRFRDITDVAPAHSIPKVDREVEIGLLRKLQGCLPLRSSLGRDGAYWLYYHNAPRYWIRAVDFLPHFENERDGVKRSSQLKPLYFGRESSMRATLAILNSSLFFWWFEVYSDCRHLNMREVGDFPAGLDRMPPALHGRLDTLTRELMADFQRHSVRKECTYAATGRVAYDEFYPRKSKLLLDRIDGVLAEHFGLTQEELDFVVTYQGAFRMGSDE